MLLLFIVVSYGHLVSFNPERFRLVDKFKNNYMFRSNSLLTEDLLHVNFTAIKNNIQKLINRTLPEKFRIDDYSLLNDKIKDDKRANNIEKKFFVNGSIFLNFPIHGEKISPYSIENITERNRLATTFNKWSRDKLPIFVDIMIEDMQTNWGVTYFVIYHCMQGVDRTGEIIGAYEMRVFNKTLEEIIQEDTRINNARFAPKKHNLNALEWYELYLKFNYKL